MNIPEIVALGLIVMLGILAFNEYRNKKITIKKLEGGFLKDAPIKDDIDFVESIEGDKILAKSINGKWGIATKERWLHQGESHYISSKWREYTNKNQYISTK